jgi:ABC-2 type transport system permease protein
MTAPSVTAVLFRVMLQAQLTKARVLGLLALGAIGVLTGLAIGASDLVDHQLAGARFVDTFGLALLAPVATLVFASAALGDPHEDGTLVYLWLRPVSRWRIVAVAVTSSIVVTWPIVVVPLVLAALATGSPDDLAAGTVGAATLAIVVYSAVFVALGLVVRRALMWGLLYILIWEGFVAQANASAARLAIRSYTRSLFAELSDVYLRRADIAVAAAWIVPLVIAALAIVYASRRLARQDVA